MAGLVVLAACGSSTSAPATTDVPRTTTTVPRVSDGVLRLGLLVPRSGAGASLGEALIPVVEASITTINVAGGFNDRNVELVIRDEGSDTATALAAVERLVDEDDVDAIIGPLSSNVALGILPSLTRGEVGVCSPAATSALLNNFPDRGLFVRTAPTDALLAQAMSQSIAQTGQSSTALAFPDDRYGRRMASELRRYLGLQGISITDEVPYSTADESYTDEFEGISDEARVLALVANQESGARFLNSALTSSTIQTIVLNDALADVPLPNDSALDRLSDVTILGVAHDVTIGFQNLVEVLGERRVFPGPVTSGTVRQPIPFATSILDCVNLIALAALSSASDDPLVFMNSVIPVSRVGSSCNTFDQCSSVLGRGLNVDYNGPTGLLALTPNGEPSLASFVNYGFDEDGLPEYRSFIGVISSP
jgi:branched-chain amino acid transport system substrate-binding protein